METVQWLVLFVVFFALIIAIVRADGISLKESGEEKSRQASLIAASGRVFAYPGGKKILCNRDCARIYGANAPNGSYAWVLGIAGGGGGLESVTVVKESWTP